MLKRFLPEEDRFFKLFQQMADLVVTASTAFHSMLHDLPHLQTYVDKIATHEREADEITYQTFQLLHKTFITPFDRNDIHRLASDLDDILDSVNRSAQRFPFYQLEDIPSEIIKLSEYGMRCCVLLNQAVYKLHHLKKANAIFQYCDEINKLEDVSDQWVLAGERILYLEEQNFKQFYKLKKIYEQTKLVITRCKNVGNLIQGIVLEYS
jgi:predicted phosphate transport protein (TIGR00153 family)